MRTILDDGARDGGEAEARASMRAMLVWEMREAENEFMGDGVGGLMLVDGLETLDSDMEMERG